MHKTLAILNLALIFVMVILYTFAPEYSSFAGASLFCQWVVSVWLSFATLKKPADVVLMEKAVNMLENTFNNILFAALVAPEKTIKVCSNKTTKKKPARRPTRTR